MSQPERFVCDGCWDRINGALVYGLIPWRKPAPESERCASCRTELHGPAIHLPSPEALGALGLCSDIIKLKGAQ